jgi:branched-subunit amino acid transport protein
LLSSFGWQLTRKDISYTQKRTSIQKQIKNQFFQSFLYYVPYVTLAIITFPAILEATESPIAGAAALIVGTILAWFGASLFKASVSCCIVVLVLELIM